MDDVVIDLPTKLSQLAEHPIKVLLLTGAVSLSAAWALARPLLVEDLSADFESIKKSDEQHQIIERRITGRMEQIEKSIDTNTGTLKLISTEIKVNAAFAMERAIQSDLEKHNSEPDPHNTRWFEERTQLENRHILAKEYKMCVLAEDRNCDLLKAQLYK